MAEEKLFENKVKRFLDECGCYWIKTHGDRYTKKGTPDLIICCRGRFIAVELKATNGRASPLQLRHIDLIKKAGGYGIILYPTGYEDFKKYIERIIEK